MIATSEYVRQLTTDDMESISDLFRHSEYRYQRFTDVEIPFLLAHYPAYGLFQGKQLQACLLSQTIHESTAWIAGATVRNSIWRDIEQIMVTLLRALQGSLTELRVKTLYYSCGRGDTDWMRVIWKTYGWTVQHSLYTYEKYDYHIPSYGNQIIDVRPVRIEDLEALVLIDHASFASLWRFDEHTLLDYMEHYPYFVIAMYRKKVLGYQCNTLQDGEGYLVRIAVDPHYQGKAIGVRLMAEAIQYFKKQQALHIILNTQEENVNAHHLYEWFGFQRSSQHTTVLGYDID
jgi:ribosomal protein S18 acetylase RimI-like enzyme